MTSESASSNQKKSRTITKVNFVGPVNWKQLIEWLQLDGLVTPNDANDAINRFSQAESSQHPLIRLAALGMQHQHTGQPLGIEALGRYLADKAGLEYLRIDPLRVDVGRVAECMSMSYAQRYNILPVLVGNNDVTVATAQPFITDWVSEVERQSRKMVKLVVSNPEDIVKFTKEFYALAESVKAASTAGAAQGVNFEQLVELGKNDKNIDANDQGVVQLVDWLWQYAFDQRASDIHLEPRREQCAMRFRIDGKLHTVYQMPFSVLNAVIARIKLLARMDVIERRRPQDGRIKTRNPNGEEVEMRISCLPTAFGEKMVMRIFDPEAAVKDLAELGFSSHDARRWEELVVRPNGIILVTGPTGSGKTTTLYSTLKRIATEEVNVSTVEDPIEMVEPRFNQTQVQPHLDLSFAEGLRSLMRQDPDIIMVGEIRDLETAQMAIQAALTGHLVFSTLHTNDAPSAITRLMELGVPPYLINATILGVLAQRLLRTLCPSCKKLEDPPKKELLDDMVKPWKMTGKYRAYEPVGCQRCRTTGYMGRIGIYELLVMTEAFKSLVQKEPNIDALRKQAVKDGMRPLRMAGALRVSDGTTTLQEVMNATPLFSM